MLTKEGDYWKCSIHGRLYQEECPRCKRGLPPLYTCPICYRVSAVVTIEKCAFCKPDVRILDTYEMQSTGPLERAVKFDDDKPRYDLIPPEMLEAAAHVLSYGAKKYAPRNWELGMPWGRVFAALMRHMWTWWRGEDNDAETGFSHLDHALCCLIFLVAYRERKTGQDDRPKI